MFQSDRISAMACGTTPATSANVRLAWHSIRSWKRPRGPTTYAHLGDGARHPRSARAGAAVRTLSEGIFAPEMLLRTVPDVAPVSAAVHTVRHGLGWLM